MVKQLIGSICFVISVITCSGQVEIKLKKAYAAFETDVQLKYAASSLYVIDAASGKVVFDKNSRIGLAPASTQKIITSVTAFEQLGKDFRYQTELSYCTDTAGTHLLIEGAGDPTLGSFRWDGRQPEDFINKILTAVTQLGLKDISVQFLNRGWKDARLPNNWIWEDFGNYYGAIANGFNWRENQFDIYLKSGNRLGDSVTVVSTTPGFYSSTLISELKSAAVGSGDNAYIFLPVNSNHSYIRGTIPINEKKFKITGSMINPGNEFVHELVDKSPELFKISAVQQLTDTSVLQETKKVLFREQSVSLDSIIYWFNKKSVNLYGEALLRTLSLRQFGKADIDSGIAIVKKFWKLKGLDDRELNIYDGSGLSPMNRVTTHAQVEILRFAKTRSWYPLFFKALPEYNGMHMKSGTIGDVKGFCGYHTTKEGKQYIFSFLVNNYNGTSASLVARMYKVLDELK